jgi:hypothetical protein
MARGAAEAFVARYSVPKLLGWFAASAGMAGLGLGVVVGALGAHGVIETAAGTLGVLFFGGIAAVHAARLFNRREQVIIDSRGVFVRSHSDTWIAVRSIKSLHLDVGRVSLTLHKPDKYPIKTRHRRLIYRLNGSAARGFFGDVWIWSNVLDQPTEAFVAAIQAHRPTTAFEQQMAAP